MASVTFPLFRLPIVALAVIFHCMNPNQVFWLSLVSKNSSRMTKTLSKKTGLKLYITFDNEDYVCIRAGGINHELFSLQLNPARGENRFQKHLSIGNTVFKYEMNVLNNKMQIYFYDNRFDLMATLYKYVTNFFGISTCLLGVYDLSLFNASRKLFEFVLSRQESIPTCSFRVRESDDEKLRYFLNTVGNRATESLEIRKVKTSNNFDYDFPQKLTARSIEWKNASWMTLDHLYAMQCKTLYIGGTHLTCEDMNIFLKNWINGASSELRVMNLILPAIDNETIFTDLEITQNDYPNDMSYSVDNDTHTFSQSFDIKRMDGTMASIILDDEDNREFFMVVWPDFNGKPYPIKPVEN